jgi:hypothetical protein
VGDEPTEVKVRRVVAWVAGRKETEFLKPTDKAIQEMVSPKLGGAEGATALESEHEASGLRLETVASGMAVWHAGSLS